MEMDTRKSCDGYVNTTLGVLGARGGLYICLIVFVLSEWQVRTPCDWATMLIGEC
jgi:hypothetical protein